MAYPQLRFPNVDGNSDLVSYFFRSAFDLLAPTGAAGLLATNTICQGDTRRAALGNIIAGAGQIYRARKRYPWPGEASVIVSVVHFLKSSQMRLPRVDLDGNSVSHISSFLIQSASHDEPSKLLANKRRCFRGVSVMGDGFIISMDEAGHLLREDEASREIIRPYIGGREVNGSPECRFERYVINFGDRTLDQAKRWPSLLYIVEERVKPERDKRSGNAIALRQKKYWWLFRSDTPVLREALATKARCIVASEVGPHLSFVFQPVDQVFANTLNVFALDKWDNFAALQARIHEVWARLMGSSMKDDLRYNLSDCFETFPFPSSLQSEFSLEDAGAAYHNGRAALMTTRNEGLTKTYNRFHDPAERSPDIQRLRELHHAMDVAALRAYGWNDLADRAAPEFLTEETEPDHRYQGRLFWPALFRDEVLARLLDLNRARAAEERALGLSPGRPDDPDEDQDEAA